MRGTTRRTTGSGAGFRIQSPEGGGTCVVSTKRLPDSAITENLRRATGQRRLPAGLSCRNVLRAKPLPTRQATGSGRGPGIQA